MGTSGLPMNVGTGTAKVDVNQVRFEGLLQLGQPFAGNQQLFQVVIGQRGEKMKAINRNVMINGLVGQVEAAVGGDNRYLIPSLLQGRNQLQA